jgi:hypothetical protein
LAIYNPVEMVRVANVGRFHVCVALFYSRHSIIPSVLDIAWETTGKGKTPWLTARSALHRVPVRNELMCRLARFARETQGAKITNPSAQAARFIVAIVHPTAKIGMGW